MKKTYVVTALDHMASSIRYSLPIFYLILLIWMPSVLEAQDLLTSPIEVMALENIRRNLVDSYLNLHNWNRGNPCTSNWTGVLCFNKTSDDGYLHVRELRLLTMNLSGTLSPSIGDLSRIIILDFMWNNISGHIPKEIGRLKSLKLLLLNGNRLTGTLPPEIGNLPNLERLQIDENNISGPIPVSFANLNATEHFHMNNNSLSGTIPHELSRLPKLIHLLLDNNNLSGILPPQLSEIANLLILQLDNNNFHGATIPSSYANMTKLVKLSLRNCGLTGRIPDLSRIPNFAYLDVSSNQLNGTIPTNKLSASMTTIILSDNNLSGTIPVSFAHLPHLQKLSLERNSLYGTIPSTIWKNRILNKSEELTLNFESNRFTDISGSVALPQNVSLRLRDNPLCSNLSFAHWCGFSSNDMNSRNDAHSTFSAIACPPQSCPSPYEYSSSSPLPCFCAAPVTLSYRLKSPAFSDFLPYETKFKLYVTTGLKLYLYQLEIESLTWEVGPRLELDLKFFPVYERGNDHPNTFNSSEIRRILTALADWDIQDDKFFGPYEVLYFSLSSVYQNVVPISRTSRISKSALAGIILGAMAAGVVVSGICFAVLWMRKNNHQIRSRERPESKAVNKIAGVKIFRYAEMELATDEFNSSREIGKGGYGVVYKGTLPDGTAVAIKRAQGPSLQGEREFLTEIEYLSRVHHKNLVSLVGYCDEEGEQLLVYHLMANGTLKDNIQADEKEPLSFSSRLRIALDSARGILYLHTEADPPIFHRDIKSSNILLDAQYTAKVADFGLSRLAPSANINEGNLAYVSTVVRGTPGYIDPEYVTTHRFSDRSDVYSFGVVLLELLTGMKPIARNKLLVQEVRAACEVGDVFSMIDPRMGSYPSDCADKLFDLALRCCNVEADLRPSMAEAVRNLESICGMLPENDEEGTEGRSPIGNASPAPENFSYMSMDVSGSNLVSGTVPTIHPR